MRSAILVLIGVAVGLVAGLWLGEHGRGSAHMERDTVVVERVDTLRDTLPIEVRSEVVRYEPIRIRVDSLVRDTVNLTDTAFITLPISQKCYEDSLYRAWVSGYGARLDSIEVFRRTQTITIVEKEKRRHWHIGPTVGAAYGIRGFTPYVGVGITYSLYSF